MRKINIEFSVSYNVASRKNTKLFPLNNVNRTERKEREEHEAVGKFDRKFTTSIELHEQ